ncbi:MAG TPA: hypothetical protein VKQ52_12975 [Puia sp.]|nr:hypothetical protein [Puia sp.]
MKQFIAIIALFFAFSFTTKAQSVYYATKSYQGTWSAYSQKYIWGSPYNVSIRFTIQGNIVLVGDRAGSTYTTGTEIIDRYDSDGGHEYGWNATDETGVNCTFKLTNYTDGSKLIEVLYSNYAYMYVIPS